AFLGHLHDLAGRAAQFAPRHQQLLDVAAALERLADGVAAAEQVLRFLKPALLHALRSCGRGVAELLVAPLLPGHAGLALLAIGTRGGVFAARGVAAGRTGGEAEAAALPFTALRLAPLRRPLAARRLTHRIRPVTCGARLLGAARLVR